ncbi:hypothetical protein Rhopal_004843-T1 [Rhodotorula paludigena]|uniref:Vesicle tethering protein Uso1/P115-like head domain-containing protein n=1 Tax=Rhodotorula paludigena TaxID=86838 RepID=A0AAV5GGX6_9BASI|nr:hypothetical protein Rhopal_004843-T1 [Rhodotorula paludigena]
MFSTLARGYNSLKDSAQPQSAAGTIDRLCERLLNGTQREDRRAALLGLKGLSRDWKSGRGGADRIHADAVSWVVHTPGGSAKRAVLCTTEYGATDAVLIPQEVGGRALPILLGVLDEDAAEDTEMAKAVVETLSLLCEVEEVDGRPVRDDSGLRNSDVFLATPTPLHTLLTLLTPSHFYLRFFSLQLLGILLANRPQQVQQYVLTSPGGIGRLVETLDDAREIIRNESLLLLIALTTQNADIQKLLAFEGAFDKLFGIVRSEGGIGSGGIVVQDCLAAVGGLLRWNVSNQNYFRETSCIPILAPLLLFPRPNALTPQSLATFAFQSWSEQKVINAGLVISIVRMLVGGAGGSGRRQTQDALLKTGLTRCLIELSLASNAPAVLKAQSLNALADIMRSSPDNQSLLTSLIVTPLIPPQTPSSPETYMGEDGADPSRTSFVQSNGEYDSHHQRQFDAPAPAASKWRRGSPVPAVVAVTSLSVNGDGTPGREGLRVRAAAANLFTSYVAGSNDTQLGILSTMSAPQPDASPDEDGQSTASSGSIILHALRVFPQPARGTDALDSYAPFFAALLFSHLVLHSEVCKEAARRIYFQGDDTEPGGEGDVDDRASLVGILVGNLMMAQREQAQSANAGLGPERALEWSRVMVAYLTALSVWMWESPHTVKEFLSEGSNLQVLIQPITQSSGVDSLIQGLCTFLLGICYEYNREPGPISRETLHPILQSRVGPDQFVSRILRLREDPRFRNVGPNVLELIDEDDAIADDLGEEDGLWFDFTFVEFLKTNYVSVQRAILVDPHASSQMTRSLEGVNPDVLAALRSSLAAQTKEIDELRDMLRAHEVEREEERTAVAGEFASLSDTIASLKQQLGEALQAKEDADREQEDLLVLLEELSEKRRRDKRRLRKAGLEVSEDEEGGEEDADEAEDDDDASANSTVEASSAPAPAASVEQAAPGLPVEALAAPPPTASVNAVKQFEPPASEPAPAPAVDAPAPAAHSVDLAPAQEPESAPAPPSVAEPSHFSYSPPAPPPPQPEPAPTASIAADVPVEASARSEVAAEQTVAPAVAPLGQAEVEHSPEPSAAAEPEPLRVHTPEPIPAPAPPPAAAHVEEAATPASPPPPPPASSVPGHRHPTRTKLAGLPAAEAIEPVVEVDERHPAPRAGVLPPPRATAGFVRHQGARPSPSSPRRPGTPRARHEAAGSVASNGSSIAESRREEFGVPAPPPVLKGNDSPVAAEPAPRTSIDDRLASAFGASTNSQDASSLFGASSDEQLDVASIFGGGPSNGLSGAASSVASLFGGASTSSTLASFFGRAEPPKSKPEPPQLSSSPFGREQAASPFGAPPKPDDAGALFDASRASASPIAPQEETASLFAPSAGVADKPADPKPSTPAPPPPPPMSSKAKQQDASSLFASSQPTSSLFAPAPEPPKATPTLSAPSAPAQSAPLASAQSAAPAPTKDAASLFGAPVPRQDASSPFEQPEPDASSPFGAPPARQDGASPFAAPARQENASPFGAPPISKQDALSFFAAPQQQQNSAASLFGGPPSRANDAASPFGLSREDTRSPFDPPAESKQEAAPVYNFGGARDVSSLFG